MSIPEGWTDDMTVRIRSGRTEAELVATVMDALLKREDLNRFLPIVHSDFGLSEEDARLTFNRSRVGLSGRCQGSTDDQPDKSRIRSRGDRSSRSGTVVREEVGGLIERDRAGPWHDWFQEVRRRHNAVS